MAAVLAPRIEKLEKDQALLRRDHDCLAVEVNDKDTGLPAVNRRLAEIDKLMVQNKLVIGVLRWVGVVVGGFTLLLLWNILTHAVVITVP